MSDYENDSRDVYRSQVTDYNPRISFLGVFRGSAVEPLK